MNTNEINETIAEMEPYSVLCGDHTWKCIKKHSQGHKYWKTKNKDIYYYLDTEKLFMFEKDFGGNYRFKEIKSVDVRMVEAVYGLDMIAKVGFEQIIILSSETNLSKIICN